MDKISIITVVYNAVSSIEKTIQSVLGQTYGNVEYVIIDGGSTDGTVDVIRRYADRLAYWVSEKDKGIYDAMNKGLRKATGEWVNFMNAGDRFSEPTTLEAIFSDKKYGSSVAVVYGDCRKLCGDVRVCNRAVDDINQLKKTFFYRHNAAFVRTGVHRRYLYDIARRDFGYALDYHVHYRMYCDGCKFTHVGVWVVDYLEDGTSNHHVLTLLYDWRVRRSIGVDSLPNLLKQLVRMWVTKNIIVRSVYCFATSCVNNCATHIPFWGCRRFFYRMLGVKLGAGTYIGRNVRIVFPSKLTIGNDTVIGDDCILNCLEKVTIGNECQIEKGSSISSVSYNEKEKLTEYCPIFIPDRTVVKC